MKTENINLNKVEEMAEGDLEFQSELINAIYTSIQDFKNKYIEGLSSQNELILQQARHKIKPTLSLFELKKLKAVLQEGKDIVSSNGFSGLEKHQAQFEEAADDLLKDLNKVM